jgi:hypothetical protein
MEAKNLEKKKRLNDLLDAEQKERLSYWQLVFLQSKVNGCPYRGDDLPQQIWDWPKKTWLQERLNQLREKQFEFERDIPALQN